MKFFTLLTLILSSSTFASEVCEYKTTEEFSSVHVMTEVAVDHGAFSALEKKMIHEMILTDGYDWDLHDAVILFGDHYYGCRPGYRPGEVAYFEMNGKKMALVRYWPSDEEHGAVYEVNGDKTQRRAMIVNGSIECK